MNAKQQREADERRAREQERARDKERELGNARQQARMKNEEFVHGTNERNTSYRPPGGHGAGSGNGCFPTGTRIATPSGNCDISQLQEGDFVTAYDPKNKKLKTRRILKVLTHRNNAIWELVFADGQKLRTTGIHSFSVDGIWKKASQIRPGEQLELIGESGANSQGRVVSSSSTGDIENVYNLVVEGNFTFFADGVAAHSFSYFRSVRMMAWNVYSLVQRYRRVASTKSAVGKTGARASLQTGKHSFFLLLILAISLTASFANAATTQIIAIEGAPSPIPGENYSLSSQSNPSLNDQGQSAFRSAGRTRVYRGNQSGVELIARGTTFGSNGQLGELFDGGTKVVGSASTLIAINNGGQLATNLNWDTPDNVNHNRDAMVLFDGGSIASVAFDGTLEPTGDGTIFIPFGSGPALNLSGQLAFASTLGSTSGGGNDDSAIYRSEIAGGLTEIVRKGDVIPGGGGTFNGTISAADRFSSPVMNDAGQVSFVAAISGSGVFDDQAIYVGTGTTISKVAQKGDNTPDQSSTGRTLDNPWSPSINNSGQIAFLSSLIGGNDTFGIYLGDNGTLERIAESGFSAPDFDGWFTNRMGGVEINEVGQVAFRSEVQSATTGARSSGIFVGSTSEQSERLIALQGNPAPNGLGVFAQISSSHYALNDNGQVAYRTWVDLLPNQSGGKIQGLFLDSGSDGVETIALEGMSLLGSTIESIAFAGTLDSGVDLTDEYQGLNNQGQVAYAFLLADGRVGVAIWSSELIGSGLLGDYNGNGIVDAADYTVWLDSLGSTTDLAADASGNNMIDQADYTVWKSNFGNTASGGTGNGEAIPEPGALVLAVMAMAGILVRRVNHGCRYR